MSSHSSSFEAAQPELQVDGFGMDEVAEASAQSAVVCNDDAAAAIAAAADADGGGCAAGKETVKDDAAADGIVDRDVDPIRTRITDADTDRVLGCAASKDDECGAMRKAFAVTFRGGIAVPGPGLPGQARQ